MYIVTVFPIIRGAFKERLSYWSTQEVKVGSIIQAPLRGKNIYALVESVENAAEAKTSIRQASFVTKKLEKTTEHVVVHPECISAAARLSYFFAAPLGSIIKTIIPDVILTSASEPSSDKQKKSSDYEQPHEEKLMDEDDETEDSEEVEEIQDEESEETMAETDQPETISIIEESSEATDTVEEEESDVLPEKVTFQSNDTDRYSSYKGIVREEFARRKSVIITVPTTVLAEELGETLKKGIEDYVIVLHSGHSKKQQKERWHKALTSDHSVVVIATPIFASLPRPDISTIIIDKESSRAYLNVRAPYIDMRTYIEYYAAELGAKLILADTLLRVETLYRREKGEVGDLFQPSFRLEKVPESIIIDMADQKRKEEKGFEILGEELLSMIEYADKRKEHMFIFCSRRGLSPQTVCGDCGTTVTCDYCSAPVVLHNSKSEENRYFLCHHCGHKRSALEKCKKCGSWKLITLGIAIDSVHDEIEKKFPQIKIFKIDRDSVTTDKQAKEVIKQFLNNPGSVLLGTETALGFLPPVPHIAVASMDSLFSLPDFRINERVCQILLRLISRTTSYLLIQTRNAKAPLLKQITSGMLMDFYRDEVSVRQAINYPPFSVQIKITIEADKKTAAEEMEKLEQILSPWNPMIFPAYIPTVKGRTILHMLLSLPPEDWPNERLRETLVALPREFTIRINPESLL